MTGPGVLRTLSRDGWILLGTKCVRLFAYGSLGVVLVLYLLTVGIDREAAGLLLMLTLLGDTALSLVLTTQADRLGRRRTLVVGAGLMLLAGVTFALTGNFWLLLAAATLGVISPAGNDVGPFLAVEQAALSQIVHPEQRTEIFAWHALLGSLSTACGALAGGALCWLATQAGLSGTNVYRPVIVGYALAGIVLALAFSLLSSATELPAHASRKPVWHFGLGESRGIVARLSLLFSLDAFGGGLVMQSVLAYWFHARFGTDLLSLGGVFFTANLLAAGSSLAASWMARKFGLVNTMVFTHLPSNVLLILIPLMPNQTLAVIVMWIRFSISQMDVPTRQSYTMAVVTPEERAAASGVTTVARSIGTALSSYLAVLFVSDPAWAAWAFYLAGGIKIVYDLLLYRSFVSLKPPEERGLPATN